MVPTAFQTIDHDLGMSMIRWLNSAALRQNILTVILPRRLQRIRSVTWCLVRIGSTKKNSRMTK